MVKLILLASTLLLPNGDDKSKDKDNKQQPLIYFEKVYNGSGDDVDIHGETIDSRGQVHCFNAKDKKSGLKFNEWNYGVWNSEIQCSEMSPEDIQKNLTLCDSVVCTISQDSLSKYVHLLNLIVQSHSGLSDCQLARRKNRNAVLQGITSLYGFVYDSNKNRYRRILIEKHGDAEQQNTSVYADEFKQWKWSDK